MDQKGHLYYQLTWLDAFNSSLMSIKSIKTKRRVTASINSLAAISIPSLFLDWSESAA